MHICGTVVTYPGYTSKLIALHTCTYVHTCRYNGTHTNHVCIFKRWGDHVYMLRPDSQPLTCFEASQPFLTRFKAGCQLHTQVYVL